MDKINKYIQLNLKKEKICKLNKKNLCKLNFDQG